MFSFDLIQIIPPWYVFFLIFFIICLFPAGYDNPHTVAVLCEEEIVFIDLTSEG